MARQKPVSVFEQLILDPSEIGTEAACSIDGLVINVKNPVRIIANGQMMTVTSTAFRENNLRYAAMGMRSWMGLTYTLTEEEGKSVTVLVKEFEKPEFARNNFPGVLKQAGEADAKQHAELRGSVFHRILDGNYIVDVQWTGPRTPGVDKIVSAYKAKLMSF